MATVIRSGSESEQRVIFPIILIHHVGERSAAQIWPTPADQQFAIAVPERDELFKFTIDRVADEAGLLASLNLLRLRNKPAQIIVLSDQLAESSQGGWQPTALVERIRATLRSGPHLAALVAVVETTPNRIHDVDVVVAQDAGRNALISAVLQAALAVWMKAPPSRLGDAGAKPPDALRVEVVQSPEILRGCLALRRRVYGLLGYLPDLVMADPSGVEMDSYDPGSIHFVARVKDDVVGTARLALGLPREPGDPGSPNDSHGQTESLVIDLAQRHTRKMHQQWCLELRNSLGQEPCSPDKSRPRRRLDLEARSRLRQRVTNCRFGPLPILESSDFRSRWGETLKRVWPAAELSRLVVAPAWRGRKVSRLLIRAALAKAMQLKRKMILLECIPTHVSMYEKYGFRRMDGDPHSRPSDLDQFAVGMELRFDKEGPTVDNIEMVLTSILFHRDSARAFGPLDVPLD